jgi:hypothetical protein
MDAAGAVGAAALLGDRDDPVAQPRVGEGRSEGGRRCQASKPERENAEQPAHQRERVIGLLRRGEPIQAHRVSLSFAKKAAAIFQDLPLLLEQQHPPTQLAQLLVLIAGQTIALTALDLRLLHPQPQRPAATPPDPRDLAQRLIGPRVERHSLTAAAISVGALGVLTGAATLLSAAAWRTGTTL